MQLYKKTFLTPIAELTVISDDNNIIRLSFKNDNCDAWLRRYCGDVWISGENELCRLCEHEMSLYFSGRLEKFNLPVKLYGTTFQKKIWNALSKVPYGKTTNYAGIAMLAGAGGARAAGGALAQNPVTIIVPCHRVISANGSLGGYCSGYAMSEIKRALLKLEGAEIN